MTKRETAATQSKLSQPLGQSRNVINAINLGTESINVQAEPITVQSAIVSNMKILSAMLIRCFVPTVVVNTMLTNIVNAKNI